jgi:hypothetical protein
MTSKRFKIAPDGQIEYPDWYTEDMIKQAQAVRSTYDDEGFNTGFTGREARIVSHLMRFFNSVSLNDRLEVAQRMLEAIDDKIFELDDEYVKKI